jgi:multidrug efflux system outer membrane protein
MKRALAAAACLALAACTVGPDYRRPDVELPAKFADATATSPLIDSQWWKLYGDARLNELVGAALARNVDLRIALGRIEETDAQLREAGVAFLPGVDLGAQGTRQAFSTTQATPVFAGIPVIRNNVRIALSTAFELDFWGKYRRTIEAAGAQAIGTRYARDVVLLTVAGLTTQAYFSLRSLDAQIALTRSSLESRQEALDISRKRAAGGIESDFDVAGNESARADAAIQLQELQRERELVEHQLGQLTGQLDLTLPEEDLFKLPVPPIAPAGLPSDLLARRPDIQQAEQQLIAANAAIGVARTALFPSISLTGSGGLESRSLSRLWDFDSKVWSVGFGLSVPIFDWGRINARIDQAQAREHQLVGNYQKSIETAFREVADALTVAKRTAEEEQELNIRAQATANALRLARLRYSAGYSPLLDVLVSQRADNDAKLAVVRNRQARLAASVDLMKALGGGWKP